MAARRATKARKKASKKGARRTTKRTSRKTSRSGTARKTTTKSRTTAGKPGRITAADKVRSKSDILGTIAEQVGISKKEVGQVFEIMQTMIGKDLSRSGPGEFRVPGMMKVVVQRKPAVPRRKGINPFTKEEQWFKAKPARNVVKVRPLKGLKDLV